MFWRLAVLAVASLLCLSANAQETPTERDAARDVLKKISTLEHSLDVPSWVTR